MDNYLQKRELGRINERTVAAIVAYEKELAAILVDLRMLCSDHPPGARRVIEDLPLEPCGRAHAEWNHIRATLSKIRDNLRELKANRHDKFVEWAKGNEK